MKKAKRAVKKTKAHRDLERRHAATEAAVVVAEKRNHVLEPKAKFWECAKALRAHQVKHNCVIHYGEGELTVRYQKKLGTQEQAMEKAIEVLGITPRPADYAPDVEKFSFDFRLAKDDVAPTDHVSVQRFAWKAAE